MDEFRAVYKSLIREKKFPGCGNKFNLLVEEQQEQTYFANIANVFFTVHVCIYTRCMHAGACHRHENILKVNAE